MFTTNNLGFTIWFTGLPSSGKTTIGQALVDHLKGSNINAILLDGDVLRGGLNKDLDFSANARHENIRRVSEIAKLFSQNGGTSVVTFISPFEKDRKMARQLHSKTGIPFFEVHLKTSLEVCERRDVKGLYKLARASKIKDMTGIQSPYEEPTSPDISLDTDQFGVRDCVKKIMEHINNNMDNIRQIETRELFAKPEERETILNDSKSLKSVQLSKVDMQWFQVLAEGWAYPLNGFMNETQYLQCLHFSLIKDTITDHWHVMPIPIVLAINDQTKIDIEAQNSTSIKLIYDENVVGIMKNIQIFPHRKNERLARKFTTTSLNHPVVNMISAQGEWLIGGDLTAINRISWNDGLDSYRLTPNNIKKIIKDGNHDAVFAFQLRNPIHNGHALLIKNTMKMLENKGYRSPILLLHPLGGYTKDDDIPLNIRIKQHEALFEEGVLDPKKTILAIFPSPMSYAGPTEVLWHCRARLICGTNYYIVGRDPAGIPHPDIPNLDLFDATHGSKILVNAPLLDTELEIVPFRSVAYNTLTETMELYDPCRKEEYEFISGTKIRKIAREGGEPPKGFMSSKAWNIIRNYYQSQI